MSELDQREQAFIDAALLLPPDRRAFYLDQAAAGDAVFRQRLDARLAARENSSPTPPGTTSANPNSATTVVVTLAPSEKAGDRIGRYKLLQQIGEGGCGIVYMAEEEEVVRRRVALKVIKLGMDTRNVIARFEAERQALAMMDHPNIAKVLDAGATHAGRPFFVMELVRGIKITEYCDQHSLSTRERIELFIKVCHAIQHAHQKGIIHRDIKPSNILVTLHDGVPVPKVIDFGIAKATDQRLTDKTLFTSFEQFIGTPAYMSPEQAEMSGLDIDTRSDIYSLGVLLYELLTGKTPFDPKQLIASGLDEMRRTIREKEPARPSTRLGAMLDGELTTTAKLRRTDPPKLVHLVRGDLDWVAMKTLDKDRTRRYDTATGLALDLQRFLDNQPILARPPSRIYQLQKFVRRHRFGVQLGAGLGVIIVVLLVVLVEEYFRAERMSRVAAANAKAAEESAAQARSDADLARRAQNAEAQLHEQVEARLALEAKMRVNNEMSSMLSKAGLLLSQGEIRKAEELVNRMPSYPASAAMYNSLALIHVGRAEWPAAIRNYTKVIELAPSDHVAYHCLAPLLAQTGDTEGFMRHREHILRQFGHTADSMIAERLARDCLLLPPTTEEMAVIRKMAKAADEKHSGEWFVLLMGLADYREGNHASAIEWVQKLAARNGQEIATVQSGLVLAMAQFQLNRTADAQANLTKFIEFAEAGLPRIGRGNFGRYGNEDLASHILIPTMDPGATLARGLELAEIKPPKAARANLEQNWNDIMTTHILIREARKLIEAGSSSVQPPK